MATVLLTTVGRLAGGTIGGAIGAVVGTVVDRALFPGKGRQGPRLGDLTVQTSSYGSAIPRLFGTMRVAGTVIWATDLAEHKHKSGGGKAGPKTTTYSYSCSFAVALSGRPIRAVHRIWADGKLLRGSAGDWKSETGYRLHPGTEGQAVDPLIASAEGIDGSPAYRGIAYAVFQDMQLADYGNRIPSLTFEVEAGEVEAGETEAGDARAPRVVAIAAELCGGSAVGAADAPATLGGFAASGDSVRGALEALTAAFPIVVRDDGSRLVVGGGAGRVVALEADELGAGRGDDTSPRRRIDRDAAGTLPDEVAVAHYEPARDYQTGLQRARRGGPGRRVERIDLPAALPAGQAKAIAAERLARSWRERSAATVRLPWRRLDLAPGGLVTLPGEATPWRIVRAGLDRMTVELALLPAATMAVAPPTATPGRATGEADAPAGTTVLRLIDLPPLGDAAQDVPRLWLAAAGTGAGWRRAELSMSLDGGASWSGIGRSAAPAVMGHALDRLDDGDAALIDAAGGVTVELLHPAMALQGADDAALIAGANLAMLGDELLQFGAAEQIGPARYRLSRLLRGRRGTEAAAMDHAAGDGFVLVEEAALLGIDLPLMALGSTLSIMAAGPGEAGAPATAARRIEGRALRPPPPVRLSATRLDDGTIRLGWMRRSRTGWSWPDGGDAPLGEEQERYRVAIAVREGGVRRIEVAQPGLDYPPADQAADGLVPGGPFSLAVEQLGTRAASSPPALRDFSL